MTGFSHKFGVTSKRAKLSSVALRELVYWINLKFEDC